MPILNFIPRWWVKLSLESETVREQFAEDYVESSDNGQFVND